MYSASNEQIDKINNPLLLSRGSTCQSMEQYLYKEKLSTPSVVDNADEPARKKKNNSNSAE